MKLANLDSWSTSSSELWQPGLAVPG